MSTKTTSVPTKVYIRTTALRTTITCIIPLHFNNILAETGQQLEEFTPSNKLLLHLGVTAKRFFQLMRGETPFLFSEACAYAAWYADKVNISELYQFIPATGNATAKRK